MRLKIVLLSVIALVCLGNSVKAGSDPLMCLPEGIKATDIVSTRPVRSATGNREIQKTTVADSLKTIKARCSKKKLVDDTGKEIRFYKLTGCWGIELPDQREVLDRQTRELADLKKCYRVIEMTCNPTGEQIPVAPPRNPY